VRYISVCSGIEGATVAWHGLGWEPICFSEVDNFPRSVLKHHYPDVPLHGDFTTIKGDEYGSANLLVGGTPCQSFSIAGLRGGLDDERGNLALEFLRLAQRARPTWVVWENVPGVLSSNGGRDFGSFLGGLGELGYGFAYRTLDAQYFGVPQRRRRVFVVGYLGDWRPPVQVLFERESMQGHPPPSREKGEDPTRRVVSSIDASYHRLQGAAGQDMNHGHSHLVACRKEDTITAYGGNRQSGPIDVATAVRAHGSFHGDFETETFLAFQSNGNTDDILAAGDNVSPTVRGGGQGGNPPAVAFKPSPLAIQNATRGKDQNGLGVSNENVMYTLDNASQHAVALKGDQDPMVFTQNQRDEVREMEIPGALASNPGAKQQHYLNADMIRRLTPVECERLQGFPDNYTQVPYRGKPAADGPRYKALGNSFAVPVVRWIGERIQMVENMNG
jgi:DNA (cytosine-5)-methyltransferase 1